MTAEHLEFRDPSRIVSLDNETCPYCGEVLKAGSSNRDHLIGRRFVPRGMLSATWNLFMRSCVSCNSAKGDLESEISAISMANPAHPDPVLLAEAARKSRRTKSSTTGKPVADSSIEPEIRLPPWNGLRSTLRLSGPPQPDNDRVYELARFQVRGAFYFQTYDAQRRRGGFWPGGHVGMIRPAFRSDWGSAHFRGFAELVASWEPVISLLGANGYFKLIIRKHPSETCWSWAVEWNTTLRTLGFFGDGRVISDTFANLPRPRYSTVRIGPHESWSMRREEPLAEADDILFDT